jgi:hypothetical protein
MEWYNNPIFSVALRHGDSNFFLVERLHWTPLRTHTEPSGNMMGTIDGQITQVEDPRSRSTDRCS